MAAENDTLRFKIGQDEYEMPMLDDLDMDEWQILYDYTGLIIDDFAPSEDEDVEKERQRRIGQPGFTRAMLHVGYRRAHPELKSDAVRKVTGEAKLIHVLEALGETASEEDAAPLESTTKPGPSSPPSLVVSNDNGLTTSTESSSEQDASPRAYWDFRIGHILPAVTKDNVGRLTPDDLMGALAVFDALFPGDG